MQVHSRGSVETSRPHLCLHVGHILFRLRTWQQDSGALHAEGFSLACWSIIPLSTRVKDVRAHLK
jgi:hypothetical protein